VEDRREALEATAAERRSHEKRVDAAKREVAEALQRQAELAGELREVRSELSAAEASRSESRAERGAAEAVSSLQARFGASVHGRVIDLVTPTRQEHALAVEVGLGRHCDAVVVDTEATARECVLALREMRARGCLFLPLASIRPRPVPAEVERAASGGRFRLLRDAVRCEPAVRGAVEMACSSTVLADTLDSAMALRYKEGVVCRVVAVDGSLLSKNGNMSGGARDALRRTPRRAATEKALRQATARRDALLGEHERCRRVTGRAEGGGEGAGAAVRQRLLDMETPFANLQRAEAGIQSDLAGCVKHLGGLTAQLEALRGGSAAGPGPLAEAERRLEAARSRAEALQEAVTSSEDEVFAPLLEELGIGSIVEYERGALAEEEGAMRLRREQVAQLSALEAARQRQRQLREAAEASVVEAEERGAAARARAAKLTEAVAMSAAAAAEAEKSQREATTGVDEARAAAEEAKEAVAVAKRRRRKAGAERAEAERAVDAAKAEVRRQLFRRHDVMLKARMEGAALPTVGGGDAMDEEDEDGGRASGRSRKGRKGRGSRGAEEEEDDDDDDETADASAPLGERATVTSSVREKEAEAATRLDYSALEARLGIRDGEAGREVLREVERLDARLEELRAELAASAPNMRASEQLATALRRLKDAEKRLAEANAEAERAEDRFTDVAQERAERFGECVRHVQGGIDGTFKSLTRSTRHPQGGTASLHVFDEHSPFTGGGVNFSATFPGKTMRSLGQLSGGEKTVAALALLFAVHSYRRAPFMVMDEVDAALDSGNVHKVSHYVRQRATHRDPASRVQCLVVSLKDAFFHKASSLIGVCKDVRAPVLTSRSLTLELDGMGAETAAEESPAPRTARAAPRAAATAASAATLPATPGAGATPSRHGGVTPSASAGRPSAPPSTGLSSLAGPRGKTRPRRRLVDDDDDDEEAKSDDEAAAPAAGRRKRGRD